MTIWANYHYLSDGTKLSATDADGNGLYYRGSLAYQKQGNSFTLESAGFPGGQFVATATSSGVTYTPNYFISDHLGSVRAVVDDTWRVLERNDYYPFGLRWDDSDALVSDNRYRYNGKEEQQFVGVPYSDYGARQYDSKYRLSWNGNDPLAEKYYPISPYAFCANNPIYYIDRDGASISVFAIQIYDSKNGTNYLQTIMDDLFFQTGLTYSVSSTGMLTYNTDSKGNAIVTTDSNGNPLGSMTARDLMTSTIDDTETAFASIILGRGSAAAGNQFALNPIQVNDFVTGANGIDNRTLGFGMTFMHELSHTNVGGGLSDTPYGAGNPGPVASRMNIIRSELDAQGANYGQRMSYPSTNFGAGVAYLSFSSSANALIRINAKFQWSPLNIFYLCIMKESPNLNLASIILPKEVFEHFDIVETQVDVHAIHIYLEQRHVAPVKQGYTYTSKGFTEQTVVQDFPLRGVPVFLHIRRRKWLEDPTGQVITSQFELAHIGTQLSPEFAAFFKDVHRR